MFISISQIVCPSAHLLFDPVWFMTSVVRTGMNHRTREVLRRGCLRIIGASWKWCKVLVDVIVHSKLWPFQELTWFAVGFWRVRWHVRFRASRIPTGVWHCLLLESASVLFCARPKRDNADELCLIVLRDAPKPPFQRTLPYVHLSRIQLTAASMPSLDLIQLLAVDVRSANILSDYLFQLQVSTTR